MPDNQYTKLTAGNAPLHYQIMDIIKRQITAGILKPGDLIPSESQLCAQYDVSRTTVRQALNQLVEENLLIRRRGKGSFVADKKLHRSINDLYSFSEDMKSLGIMPSSIIIEQEIIPAAEEVMHTLALSPANNKVFKIKRVRLADSEPILLETTYIPAYLCPNIMQEDLSSASLYTILKNRYQLNFFRATETYEAVKMDAESARLLQAKQQAGAFKIKRIAYLDTGRPFELTHSITRGDKCTFKVELQATKKGVDFSRELTL
jgi:GntR family transcriptional regulator